MVVKPIIVTVPVHIKSLNETLSTHWRTRAPTNVTHRYSAFMALKAATKWEYGVFPCTVTLTRVAPRELDDDNLIGGFKSVRDGVADWLGLADNDPRVKWRYAQQRAPKARLYSALIEIVPDGAA